MAHFEKDLRAVLARLEECEASLIMSGDRETAQLVSVAILQLRIKLNRIGDSELRALCDAMVREVEGASKPAVAKPQEGVRPRPPVSLRLVK